LTTIGGLFGRNPFGPIHEHLLKVQQCTHDMQTLIARLSEGEDVASLGKGIRRLEEEADRIKNEIRRRVTSSIWRAVERAEVLGLLGKEDDIADGAAHIARLLEVRPTPCPAPLADVLRRWIDCIVQRTDALLDVIGSARDGFDATSGRDVSRDLARAIDELQKPEQPADSLHQDLLERLFALEKDLDPVTIVVYLEISKALQTMTGATTNAAEALQRLIRVKG